MIATAPEAVKAERRRGRLSLAVGTSRIEALAIATALLLALLARAPGLGGRSFWLDEALVVHTARVPLANLVPELSTSPFGFALLERALLAVPVPAETALRLPSLLAGVTTVWALVALA